jgi:4-hydroxy-tetrahydrodipicolinate reductase
MTAIPPLRLVVHGAAGRMGQRIVACAASDDVPWTLAAAIERAGHPRQGADAGVLAGLPAAGVTIGPEWDAPADVVIDFSWPRPDSRIRSGTRSRRPRPRFRSSSRRA